VRCGSFIANDRDCSHTVKTYLTLQLGLSDGFAAALTLPLSGRQDACDGAVERCRGPVHSRGWLGCVVPLILLQGNCKTRDNVKPETL